MSNGQNISLNGNDYMDYSSTSSLKISKKTAKFLHQSLEVIANKLPSQKLSKYLSALFFELSFFLPFEVNKSDESKLYYCCWFLCVLLIVRYTENAFIKDKVDEYQIKAMNNAVSVLKRFCNQNDWLQFSWPGETFWILYYFHQLTKFKYVTDLFVSCGCVDDVTNLLHDSLNVTRYDIDLLYDEMIIISILKNAIDCNVVSIHNCRVIPIFLRYFTSMSRYIFITSSCSRSSRYVLLTMLSITFKLTMNSVTAFYQFIDNDGVRIISSFSGSHSDVDGIIQKYLSLIEKLKEIKAKEEIIHRIKNKEILAD